VRPLPRLSPTAALLLAAPGIVLAVWGLLFGAGGIAPGSAALIAVGTTVPAAIALGLVALGRWPWSRPEPLLIVAVGGLAVFAVVAALSALWSLSPARSVADATLAAAYLGALVLGALLGPALRAGRLSVSLGSEILPGPGLENLRRGVDAVLVCTGLWREPTLGGRGGGVLGGLEFLEAFKSGAQPPVPARVAVLAGGDCAMESARLSRESGALHVYVVFGGERSALHWHMPERWFATPGVHAMWEWQPLRYERAPDGGLRGLHIRHTGLGASALLEIGMAVEAMGLGPDPRWDSLAKGPGSRGIYFAGAILNGGASVASCLADGRAAAAKIHAALFP